MVQRQQMSGNYQHQIILSNLWRIHFESFSKFIGDGRVWPYFWWQIHQYFQIFTNIESVAESTSGIFNKHGWDCFVWSMICTNNVCNHNHHSSEPYLGSYPSLHIFWITHMRPITSIENIGNVISHQSHWTASVGQHSSGSILLDSNLHIDHDTIKSNGPNHPMIQSHAMFKYPFMEK